MLRKDLNTIRFENISLKYDGGLEIFADLNLEFPKNEIIWVRGEGGSGKSSLLKILAGLQEPTSGRYLVNDECVNDMSFEEFLPYRCNIGYSFDFGGLINNRTIMSNLLLAHEYHGYDFGAHEDFFERMRNYLKMFGLDDVAQKRPSSIIGGQRKAACVARAFTHEPQVLLLDDPTTGLRRDVVERLKQLLIQKKSSERPSTTIIASADVSFMAELEPVVFDIFRKKIKMHGKKELAS